MIYWSTNPHLHLSTSYLVFLKCSIQYSSVKWYCCQALHALMEQGGYEKLPSATRKFAEDFS